MKVIVFVSVVADVRIGSDGIPAIVKFSPGIVDILVSMSGDISVTPPTIIGTETLVTAAGTLITLLSVLLVVEGVEDGGMLDDDDATLVPSDSSSCSTCWIAFCLPSSPTCLINCSCLFASTST